MNIQDKVLVLNRLELLETIQNNPDKSDKSKAIEQALLYIVYKKRYFTSSEYGCILNHIKWVLKNNVPFRKKMNLSNARFYDFWVWPDVWPPAFLSKRLDDYIKNFPFVKD
jgi:hypothetical protein